MVVTLEERWLLESLKNLCFLLRFPTLFLLLLRINVNKMAQNPGLELCEFSVVLAVLFLPVHILYFYR